MQIENPPNYGFPLETVIVLRSRRYHGMIQAQHTRGEPTTNEDRASEGRHTITLRLSRPLVERLRQAAALNRRSMTPEIAFAIEQGLATRGMEEVAATRWSCVLGPAGYEI